jgi:hypothetical protein
MRIDKSMMMITMKTINVRCMLLVKSNIVLYSFNIILANGRNRRNK